VFEVAGLEHLPVSVESYNGFIADCCLNIPESYEASEGTVESRILRYIRDLEAGIAAARALLSESARIETKALHAMLFGGNDAEEEQERGQAGQGTEETEEAAAGLGNRMATGATGESDSARCTCRFPH
jgi:hypothetical protein